MTSHPLVPHPARSVPRPTLLPGLRRLWRSRRTLQLGVDPARAVVLELPDAGTARLLDLLDGTRSERTVLAEARRKGISEPDARALLDTLCAAGLVVGAQSLLPHNLPEPLRRRLSNEAAALALRGTDAPATPAQILRRRSAARVVVAGYGGLITPVAVTLAQAGVGHVSPIPASPVPVAGPAGSTAARIADAVSGAPVTAEAIAEVIARAAPGTRTGPLRRRETTFVVQVGISVPAALAAAGYARHRLAHLAVSVRDGTVMVGPLVPPTGRPCLNCVDLHRRDRDPDWAILAAQLAAAPDLANEPCAAATALTAAGLAAGEVLRWLDGAAPVTHGASLEVTATGELRRRSWPPHPGCHCFLGGRRTRNRPRAQAQSSGE